MSEQSDPQLSGFADAIIGLETTLNYVLEMAFQQGVLMRLEAEVIDQPHLPSRTHLRIVTPDMEVTDDLPDKPRKAALRPASGEEAS